MGPAAARVLVVDVDERFTVALTVLLETAGLEVVGVARHGAEALSKIELLRPDVVTMDVDLPLLDGRKTATFVREWYPETAVVFVATYPPRELANGSVAAIAKAHVFERLVPEVHRLLR
jgi:chemotaxis response regulator CheB